MEKQKTSVFVRGREYTVLSSDPPEYLRRVASYADRKLKEISLTTRLLQAQADAMAAMNLADELMKAQSENQRLRRENRRLAEELTKLKAEKQ